MRTLKKGMSGDEVKLLQRALGVTADGAFGKITEGAVIGWQSLHGLVADGIVGKLTWRSLGVTQRGINEIIVHCTATKQGQAVTTEQIDRWHKQRGFRCIGYHYVVYLDGSVHQGRNVDEVGAHCTGHNAHSIGVCYVGGLDTDAKTPKDTRTLAQKAALLDLIRRLKRIYPNAVVHGHRDWAAKACPCFDATKEYKDA